MNDSVRSDGLFDEASLDVAVLAGVVVSVSVVRPTGILVVDAIETVAAVALVCVLGSAPWWMVVGAAGVAGAMALGVVPVVLAGLAFAIAARAALQPERRVEIVYEFEADHPNAAILERRQPLAERG